mmetsp:Transcript_10782/g.24635  ORF Transcript_10782/g.24635 Transcript_10782/m.24635 type:complete len:314 (+) Transcript_10782:140-1081(+)
MLSTARSNIADRADEVAEQDRVRFLQKIGIHAAQARVRSLSERARLLQLHNPQSAASHKFAPKQASCFMPESEEAYGGLSAVLPQDTPTTRAQQAQALEAAMRVSSPHSPQSRSSPRSERMRAAEVHSDLDEVKKKVTELSRKFRDDLVYEWRHHEVSLQPRPTASELDDPSMRHFSSYRRPHHRVIIGRDEREIRAMPEICINDELKQSLLTMRENLFQRRLNLAIYERSIREWTPQQIRAHVRRQQKPDTPQDKASAAARRQSVRLVRNRTGGMGAPGGGRNSQEGPSGGAAAGGESHLNLNFGVELMEPP